jgi:DNA polymerase III epsilon subunit-like protein
MAERNSLARQPRRPLQPQRPTGNDLLNHHSRHICVGTTTVEYWAQVPGAQWLHTSRDIVGVFAAQGIELGPWICTYKCALRVWPELGGHSNQEPRYAVGRATPFPGFDRSTISPHRAAFDVVVTAAIFEELIKRARWSELVQWSVEPALHTRFHFGKYRGQRYDAIAASDPDYLRWIVEKSELDEGIKHSAGYWLRQQR